jgi:hypothetical protein
MNKMNKIFFQPYIGQDYATGGIFGKRIMVLGESHYCEEECSNCGNICQHRECATFTRGVLVDYLNEDKPRKAWMNTFLKFERSLVGHETDWAERKRIWQSVLFFNYLQVAMRKPRQAGVLQQYEDSHLAFYEVLDEYRPQCIIVWGKRLWNYLPGDCRWQEGQGLTVEDNNVKTGNYALIGGGDAEAMAVNHPSVGYSWNYWYKVISLFLASK